MTLGKLFTHTCLCHQAVWFGAGCWRSAILRGSWGNREPGGK